MMTYVLPTYQEVGMMVVKSCMKGFWSFDKYCDPVMNFYLKNHFLTSQQAPEGMIHSKKLQKRPHI